MKKKLLALVALTFLSVAGLAFAATNSVKAYMSCGGGSCCGSCPTQGK